MRATEREFGHLIERHQSMVFSIALHMLRDRPAAEDIAQDVFLALHQNLGGLESEAHVVSWLRRVACQRSIDHCRKQRYRRHGSLEMMPEPAVAAEAPDAFLHTRLWQQVSRLPARARAIVVLRYQEDLAPPEIAALMDVPLATVKSQLHRSLAVLRNRVAGTKGALR